MDPIIKALAVVVALVMMALPHIFRAIAASKRRREEQNGQGRDYGAPSPPRPAGGPARPQAPVDPFEELRRKIEAAAQRRREEQARRTGAPIGERPAPAPRPQPQMPPRPVEPRPQPQYRQAEPIAQRPMARPAQQRPQPAPKPVQPAAQERRKPPARKRAPVTREERLGHVHETMGPLEPVTIATETTTSAWERIQSLPPLKRAIVMAEIIAKPRSMREDIY